ncbi:hypothetical protein AB3X91_17035 [Paraburkholderia sp. BR14263]|uniref:hypothetical protein n=1 Tax=unclassified Paraburkholderia TaxID=2615204 RepID=UPI0034CE468F
MAKKMIAFALSGLAGFNAHGAGFLAAATHLDVKPDLVTASSGQLIVLAEWLRGTDLKNFIRRSSVPAIFGPLKMALTGLPGVFAPATVEYWLRWNYLPTSLNSLSAYLLPAQVYIPTRSEKYFAEISTILNEAALGTADIGVVFNAYDPVNGKGFLFGNCAAMNMLPDVKLLPITPKAVEAALWLSLYGFEGLPNGLMDGAYHRPCVISELHSFDQIFAVRPLAHGWHGEKPASWFDVQDWQCEMWFSAGYDAEVADIKRINKLVELGALTDERYRIVDLREVLTKNPCGYFNFFSERPEVFEDAYEEAMKNLQ